MTDFSAPFVAMFESLGMGPTFSKGRRAAKAGHVRSLTISSSLVVGRVRTADLGVGHRTRIAVRAYGASEWARIEQVLAAEARYAADLLAGRMPADITTIFARLDLPLLPEFVGDVAMDCDCQGWPMPCSHLAATCYALARAFDTDPFGILAWRGRSRDELLLRLRDLRGGARATPARAAAADLDVAGFWGTPPGPAAPTHAVPRTDALLDELGPLIVDGVDVTALLRPAYRAMGSR